MLYFPFGLQLRGWLWQSPVPFHAFPSINSIPPVHWSTLLRLLLIFFFLLYNHTILNLYKSILTIVSLPLFSHSPTWLPHNCFTNHHLRDHSYYVPKLHYWISSIHSIILRLSTLAIAIETVPYQVSIGKHILLEKTAWKYFVSSQDNLQLKLYLFLIPVKRWHLGSGNKGLILLELCSADTSDTFLPQL